MGTNKGEENGNAAKYLNAPVITYFGRNLFVPKQKVTLLIVLPNCDWIYLSPKPRFCFLARKIPCRVPASPHFFAGNIFLFQRPEIIETVTFRLFRWCGTTYRYGRTHLLLLYGRFIKSKQLWQILPVSSNKTKLFELCRQKLCNSRLHDTFVHVLLLFFVAHFMDGLIVAS